MRDDEIRNDSATSPYCIHDSRIRRDYYVPELAWLLLKRIKKAFPEIRAVSCT